MCFTPFWMVTEVSFEQPAKAWLVMVSRFPGMETLVKPDQENAFAPMAFRPLGRVTVVRDSQARKASLPISRRLVGRVMERSFMQPQNAPSPMAVTPLGMVTAVRQGQLQKASVPMVRTLRGMTTEAAL